MDFDTAKENIQPLACGRNAEQLEVALIAESDAEYHEKLLEQRKEFERAIEHYEGDDPIQPWYDYIVWVEQSYPKSGKESAWYELVAKCLAKFENDPKYFQDRRMLKLYIKYIDCEPDPPQFYEQLYNNGIGTMIADLYLCWAHYYDYCDNFEKAESVYRKGLDARAQPLDSLEQAHKQFGFSMSQRLLYKDDVKQQEFRSSMEEKRLALTSLRAHKHKHVGSIRTGSAVKSHNPGRVQLPGGPGLSENRRVQIFDESQAGPSSPMSSSAASTSVVQTILNSTKKQENLREPGPWSKAKIKSKPLFGNASSSSASTKLAFSILADDDPIPLADGENNYGSGIQLPSGFARSNFPQKDDFDIPIHRDDEIHKSRLFKYDKFMVFPSEKISFSLEELKAYKWFKKNNIENNFTRIQAKVWENGYGIPIRLPPDFKRKNRLQEDDMELSQFDPKVIGPGRAFSFKIDLIYAPDEEYSPEEILQAKWINGELQSQKETFMELTIAFERREDVYKEEIKRRSMALGGRKSILPRTESPRTSLAPRKSMAHRKSIATIMPTEQPKETVEQPSIAIIAEQNETEEPETKIDESEPSTSSAARKVSLSKRKSVYDPKMNVALETIPESFSPPVSRRKIDDEVVVEKPKAIPFSIFQDDEANANANDDNDIFKAPPPAPVKPQASAFQEEDDCNTQMFNFFIKSQQISTPKVSKTQSLLEKDNGELPSRKELDYGDDKDSSMHEVNEEPQWKLPFGSRSSSDMANQYTFNEPNEMYRQKLSAIMEMTEESPTISSSGATTTSSKSSNEDFDFTRNQQSTTRSSAYLAKTSNMSRVSNLSKINEVPAIMYEHTLPPAAQLVIYEDEKELTSGTKQSASEIDESTLVANDNNTSVVRAPANKSIFTYGSDATLPTISKLFTEKTVDISQLPVNQSKNRTLNAIVQKNISVMAAPDITACDPSMFKLPPEETVTTQFVMNFAEEKTEKVPEIFNTREISFKPPPPMMEEPESMYIPSIPGDMTLDIPPLNGSVFEMPREPTMPIMPKLPTKGDPDEITTNFSLFQPFGFDKTARDTDLIAPKMDMPETPVFEIYQDDTGLVLNKSKINSDNINKMTLGEDNSKIPFDTDDAIGAQGGDLNDDKENMKMTKSFYANINQTRSHKDVDDELWEMIKSPDQSRNAIDAGAGSIGNKSISRKSIKPSVDDELYAMLNSPPVVLSKTHTFESEANKSKVQLQKSIIQVDEPVTAEQIASTSSIVRKSELPSMRKSELPLNSSVKQVQSIKPKSNIDDELYAMINSPEPSISSIQIQPSNVRESNVQQQSKLDAPSLLEPMKEMSINEYQKNATVNMSNENGYAMSEEIPNTALFSLNMASIKNSTIVGQSLNERRSASMHIKSEQSSLKDMIPANQPESGTILEEDESEDLEISGIELTEKEMVLLGNKNRSKFNQTTSASSSNVVPEPSNTFPQFVLSAPISIRPSQFQPNDTKLTESFNQTASQTHVNTSKLSRPSLFNKNHRESRFDGSVLVVEDTEDLSHQIHIRGNSSRKDSMMNSPYKNHYEANPRLNETIGLLKDQIDPFDIHLQNAFLDDIDFHEYIQNLDHVLMTARLGAIESDTDLVFHDKTFHIGKQVGKGSFGFVYSGKCKTTGKLYAFKQERPPNYWEFYISLEIASRVADPQMLSCFLTIDYALIGTNSSIFVSEYCEYGSLFDICNRHKVNTCRNLDEIITMILSDQMLSILDHLHASYIIHGDIKPDNFLLVKKLSYGTNELSIKLIDYGRAIDLNFLPPKQTFTTVLNTKNFICTEMMEGRPWKYQIDLFCMASTIYTLLCGKYMNVKKQPGSKLRPYVLSEGLPSYCEVQMWENVLYPLINVENCNTTPDLQKLRLQIREVIASKERFISDKINKFNAILDA